MLARVILLPLAAIAALQAAACTRPCESSANCVRTCSCLNETTNLRLDCSVAFRCEGDTRSCEAAHDEKSCDEVCAEYAGSGRCGVERCGSDAECVKTIACPLVDVNGTPTGQFADCTLGFRCQPEFEACQPRSTASDAELCANECVTGVIPTE
jgi:hypothetical protein